MDISHASNIKHAVAVAPAVFQGVSYMVAIISSIASLAAGFGLGWYIKGRGMTGVENDLANVKTDVENLKNMVRGVAPVA